MIPASNVGDLHLPDEVVDAAKAGKFHVWSVDTISDGIELLTGGPAGVWDVNDGWTEDSVFGACQERLEEMARSCGRRQKAPTNRRKTSRMRRLKKTVKMMRKLPCDLCHRDLTVLKVDGTIIEHYQWRDISPMSR